MALWLCQLALVVVVMVVVSGCVDSGRGAQGGDGGGYAQCCTFTGLTAAATHFAHAVHNAGGYSAAPAVAMFLRRV